MARVLARAIHVLPGESSVSDPLRLLIVFWTGSLYFRIAKAMPVMVNFENFFSS